ncbi:hypothetical protein ACOJUR_11950 [Alicyclobacillus tolerans]|uniref:hypothetical protein n=1 Tax=Alicyclobacillus tolerans TaxID=90970 RepID=UPI003B820015
MKEPKRLDWTAFMRGKVMSPESYLVQSSIKEGLVMIAAIAPLVAAEHPMVVEAATIDNQVNNIKYSEDASWADYIVPLIKHQALPLTITMICWAGLEMIIRKPASALDRAKWAIIGYAGMQFVIPFVKGLGHKFGDV